MRFRRASMPFDGHGLPMTGLAKHLIELGHELRFDTGPSFGPRLEKLGLAHVPFTPAVEINGQNTAGHFPELRSRRPLETMADCVLTGRPPVPTS